MASTRILGRPRGNAALCAFAAMLVVCASAFPASAQHSEDVTRLNTRLFEAVRKNDIAGVRTVLTQGADPMARDATGQTAAGAAVDQGYFEIAHYILSVRNQQQAQRQRAAEIMEREGAGAAGTASAPTQPVPSANQSVREPLTPSWRANESKGSPTEVPSARLTPPRDAVVITPAEPKRGKAAPAAAPAPQPAPAKSATTRLTPTPGQAPQLSNLPRLPSGAPNPFDPAIPAQPTLPVVTATGSVPAPVAPGSSAAPAAPPQAAPAPAAAAPAPEKKGTNPFGRLWNGLTDWFSEREPPASTPRPQESSSVTPSEAVTRLRATLFPTGRPQDGVEPLPVAHTEASATAPTPLAEPPAPTGPDPIARFFASLFRAKAVAAAPTEPPAAVPPELALDTPPPLVYMSDEPLPLPIIADPAFHPTKSEPEPQQEVAAAAPAPAPTAKPAAPQTDWLGDFLRGLFRSRPVEPVAKPKTEDAPRIEVAALGAATPEPETAPAPAALTLAPPSGPLAIEDFSLTRRLDASSRAKNCFQKGRLPGWYCLETAAWPAEIGERMEVGSWVFGHGRVIVHYDNLGVAQSLYAIFPTEHFNHIVRFLEAKLGPASTDANRTVAMVGEPNRLNLITTWTRREDSESRGTVLEMRKFDTARGMIPDTRHGTLSLAREGATPMFRYVAEADLMMQAMQMRRDSLDTQP